MNKILIVMPYFERPKMVLNALKSFSKINYEDYVVAIIDDGSEKFPINKILEKNPQYSKNVVVYNTFDTVEQKLARGGSIHGNFMNTAIREQEADICVMLSDDDAIESEYCKNLNSYYENNPHVKYAYSHIIPFDPLSEDYDNRKSSSYKTNANIHLNKTHPLNPNCQVDATQVSWRRECNVEDGVWFAENRTKNLDADFYQKMFDRYGYCVFTGFVSCYKGFHSDQLGNREGDKQYVTSDLKNCEI